MVPHVPVTGPFITWSSDKLKCQIKTFIKAAIPKFGGNAY